MKEVMDDAGDFLLYAFATGAMVAAVSTLFLMYHVLTGGE